MIRDRSTQARGSKVSVLMPVLMLLNLPLFAGAQDVPQEWLGRLQRVVPEADGFTDRRGRPPVFEAYRSDPSTGQEILVGYAFLTSDVPPEQLGYNGPIEVLVGMNTQGLLTGIEVVSYVESLRRTRGDFLAEVGYHEQFVGKDIGDAFQVRRDVDGISGATITVDAMARGIRNAARAVAFANEVGPWSAASAAQLLDAASVTLDELANVTWSEMLDRGLVEQILVMDEGRIATDLKLMYLRDEAIAEAMIGSSMVGEVFERTGVAGQRRHWVVAGADGPLAGALNLARISIVQSGDTIGLTPEDVLLFGAPREGKMNGQVRFTRVLLVDEAVDMNRPFMYELDLRPGLGVFRAEYPGLSVRARSEHLISRGGGWAATMGLLVLLLTVAIARRRVLSQRWR
jgi:hypothetical protein